MKVILINDQLNAGGAEKLLVTIANLLFEKNVDVEVILLLEKAVIDNQINPKIPIKYLNRKGRFDFKSWITLKSWVKTADIVHIHSRYNLRYYMIVKMILGISKPKVVFHEHMPRFELDLFTKFLFTKIQAYIAVYSKMKEWVVNKKILNSSIAWYLPNFVQKPKVDIKANNQSNKILMIGNFWHLKNHQFAIELINELPEFELDIYGMIYETDYFNQLKKQIENNNLQSRVRLIEGVQNVYEIMHKYSFALHTSTSETGPLVLIEYMHCQMPFLSFNTGDVVQTISNYLPDLVINNFEKNIWLEKIQSQMLNQSKREIILQTFPDILKSHFSEMAYYNELHKIYQQVLA
jgi:glycosyltransferase involved in cell wall biosynthesis